MEQIFGYQAGFFQIIVELVIGKLEPSIYMMQIQKLVSCVCVYISSCITEHVCCYCGFFGSLYSSRRHVLRIPCGTELGAAFHSAARFITPH